MKKRYQYIKICSTLILFLLLKTSVLAQKQSDFKIFYDAPRYNASLNSIIAYNNNFVNYKLMVGAFIDPKKTGYVDKEVFIKSISFFFPNSKSSGILCIDLENTIYHNLYKFGINSTEFREASQLFIWMLQTVKKIRPEVKVGFYGIPFRAYYANKNNTSKLDVILSKVDYIFPSLYTMYPNKQIGKARNEKYLKDNLEIALDFGVRLNKPVVPFLWNLVHPSNKKFGGQLVDKNEVLQNIDFIKKFKYKNKSVVGIVWWDPDSNSFSKMIKSKVKSYNEDPKAIQSELFKDYLEVYMK